MKTINRLKISLDVEKSKHAVGELVFDEGQIYFKYYPSFIDLGIHISPFKLPLSPEILTVDTRVFEGLFGVFNDSLPDGWGRLILDQNLKSKGIQLNSITPLDRLSFVGNNGVGALTYEPVIGKQGDLALDVELDVIAAESRKVLEGDSTELIDQLIHLGGSSGGARPKIFVGYDSKKDRLFSTERLAEINYEPWLIKFPSSTDPKDIANIEYAYYKMAIDSGIEMSDSRLFVGKSGAQYFGTKRFDRSPKGRLHLHSAAGLLHDNFRLSNMDYGHLMDAAFRLENSVEAYDKVLRLAAFNVFAHNRDDHSKNVSFLMDKNGDWSLAPAYDLTFSFSSTGFHSTTIAGEGRYPGEKQLLELANTFGCKNIGQIIDQVLEVTNQWRNYATECGVSRLSVSSIQKTLDTLR